MATDHERHEHKRKYAKRTSGKQSWKMKGYADFGGDIGRIYAYQIADYTKKHMRLIDRLDFRKVGAAMLYSLSILSHSVEEPNLKNGNWKYFRDV